MGAIKLPHASGNSMSIAAPATNPASDLELKLPATIGSANQLLKNSGTAGTLEFSSLVDDSGSIEINSPSITTDAKLAIKGNDTNNHDIITAYSNTATRGSFAIRNGSGVSPSFLVGTRGGAETLGLMTNGTERIRIHATGDVMDVKTEGTGNSNYGMIVFRDGGGTYCGQITSNGSNHTTSYVTNSDYRLKQNEVSISDGITRLKQLKPYRFEWKTTGDKVDGFFAHEAQTVVPECIVGTKDEVDSDNKPVYQGIDQSKIVPLLTAALQEAITEIETLKTKVATLEAT